ncbi:LacI family transcriptional regulator [Caldicoprobacter guelmensis]|uniref:LacI family DNA-binding transcriptional regulator n=1 Tax=Caldicoprobacter guelmensis TaxID=1170224 RepID=UPI001959E09C|nr:LacI family DNA-binding transcriptional regulator [Caldicoprobacter guelmensis]MBM7583450.1 LacI family transcriptional regulator [Caldicoprobacter guelmensis]
MAQSSKKGSIKIIAERTNLSPVTVSIVLNGRGDEMRISKETQERIWEEARKIGYRPNIYARRLKKQQYQKDITMVIGILWPSMYLSDLLVRFFNGIQHCILEKKMNIEVIYKPYYTSHINEVEDIFIDNLFNGVIVVGASDSDIEYIEKLNSIMPIIVFNRQSSKYSCVHVDDYSMGEKVAKLLAARGHKKVGLIGAEIFNRNFSMRKIGFLDGCKRYGVQVLDQHIVSEVGVDIEAGRKCMEKIIASGDLPSAIFLLSSTMAYGVYSVLKEKEYHIPQDIEIIGCSDIPTCELLTPKMTVIDFSIEKMVFKSLQLLTDLTNGIIQQPVSIIEDSYFIIRESCGGFPKEE